MAIRHDVLQEQGVWASADSLQFFQTHRQNPDDLYPSERFFLPDILPQVTSVLDVGSAAGGFSRIMKSFNSSLRYTGVDINREFVEIARRAFPESTFSVGDGITFDTASGTYDLVHSAGILHLNSRFKEIVEACYRQARLYFICDFRATWGTRVEGTFKIAFDRGACDRRVLPYIVLNVRELTDFLHSLKPTPEEISIRGYYHPPSPMASVPLERVLMAAVAVRKPAVGDGRGVVTLQLPGEDT